MSAAEELAGLDRVLTRLAVTEDVNLEQVLQKLIPAVVRQLKTPHDASRKKVLEILAHVNKRLKANPAMPLPLTELVSMACGGQETHPMVRSFALVYSETAFERATPKDRLAVFPTLMQGVSQRPAQQRNLVLRLALSALDGQTQALFRSTGLPASVTSLVADKTNTATATANTTSSASASQTRRSDSGAGDVPMTDAQGSTSRGASEGGAAQWTVPADVLQQYPFLSNEQDRLALLEAATRVLLYQPQSTGPKPNNPLEAAQMAAQQGASTAPSAPPPPPPGLSPADVTALTDKSGTLPSGDTLNKRKLGVLNFLAGGVASPTELLVPFLVAACDPHEPVARLGEEQLKRTCVTEGHRPTVDLERSPALLTRLFALFHGTAGTVAAGDSGALLGGLGTAAGAAAQQQDSIVPVEERTQPASAAVRSRILSLLCRSIAATSVFPATILTIQKAVYGNTNAPGSHSARLRSQGMEFAVWVSRHCPVNQLKAMAPAVLEGLLRTLRMGGASDGDSEVTPLSQDHAAVTLRGFAYQAVGCLATRVPEVMSGRVDLARSFFAALAEEPPGLRATVAEATASLAAAFQLPTHANTNNLTTDTHMADAGSTGSGGVSVGVSWQGELDSLLLSSVTSNRDAVRMCAVQWANRIYPTRHAPARWVCVLAASDTKMEVREEAARGLRLHSKTLQPLSDTHTDTATQRTGSKTSGRGNEPLPFVTDLLTYATQQLPALSGAAEPNRPLPLQPRSYLALLSFSELCWRTARQVSSGVESESVPSAYLALLEGALTRQATGELLSAALEALMDAAQVAPKLMEERLSARLSLLQPLLAHTDASTRLGAARLLGIASAALTPEAVSSLLEELLPSFGVDTHSSAATTAATTTTSTAAAHTHPTAPPKYELQEGSIMAAGFVCAQCVSSPRGAGPYPPAVQHAVAALLRAAEHQPHTLLAAGACQAVGYIGIAGGAHALLAITQALPTDTAAKDTAASTAAAPATPPAAPASSANGTPASAATSNGAAKGGSAASVGTDTQDNELSVVLGPTLAGLYKRVAVLVASKDAKVSCRALSAAGLLAWSWEVNPSRTPATHTDTHCMDVDTATTASTATQDSSGPKPASPESVALRYLERCVVAQSTVKSEEVQFAAGEAVALLFGGVGLSPSVALRTPFTSLADTFALLKPTTAPAAGNASASPAAQPATAQAPETGGPRGEVQQSLLKKLTGELISHSRAEVRCAATVWLVSLLTYTRDHPALLARLPDIQEALGGLLGDSNELTQEMASRGVSIVYELGDSSQRSQLVQALVGVLQGSGPKAVKVKLQADTKVFEEGSGVGTSVPGGAGLSTYQELCSLATDLGQPDLVYKFMDLAHHQQALNTRRGAAFGFANVAKLAGDALAPHVAQLVPKLYRYQYDPNPRVQDAMASIWRALVADPKSALDAAYPALMSDLLKELGGRLWRNRQASCSALADLIQGRRWCDLSPYLAPLWTMTFRVMDDIKESVRQAGELLMRSVRNVTLRLCDQTLTSHTDAAEATRVVLPLMLDQGLLSSVKEVRGVSLDIVSKVARTAGSDALKPILPKLVEGMLEGLSSFEDARLNYLEQHAERIGIDSEKLDSARSSAARASPLTDTLDLAARIAGSDAGGGEGGSAGSVAPLLPVLSTVLNRGVGLNTKIGAARFIRNLAQRAGNDVRPHAPALIKPLMSALRKERSMTVRKAYANAIAQVCRYASDKRVEKVVEECVTMYGGSEGTADTDTRLCGGLVLRELLHGAPETFQKHAPAILPLAFGARMDEDTSVANVWREEITSQLCEGITSQQWGRKKACANAITALTKVGSSILPSDSVGRLCETLLSELPGRLWDGKETLLSALGALCAGYTNSVRDSVSGGHSRVLEAVLTAVARKKRVYRAAALACLESCLRAFPGDYLAQVAPVLLEAIDKHTQHPNTAIAPSPATTAQPTTSTAPAAAAGPSSSAAAGTAGTATAAAAADSEEDKPLPLQECLNCLTAALPHVTPQTVTDAGSAPVVAGVVRAAGAVVGAPLPWQSRLAALQLAQALSDRCKVLVRETGEGSQSDVGGTSVTSQAVTVMRQQCGDLLLPVSTCVEEINLQQVRSTGLTALESLLQQTGISAATTASSAQPALPPPVLQAVLKAVQAVISTDKSGGNVAAAQRIKASLGTSVTADAPGAMDVS